MDLTVPIGVDANKLSEDLGNRLHANFTEPQIVEAVFTVTIYVAVSKLGDALGMQQESVFPGLRPILELKH